MVALTLQTPLMETGVYIARGEEGSLMRRKSVDEQAYERFDLFIWAANSDGLTPNCAVKHLVKYEGLLKPT